MRRLEEVNEEISKLLETNRRETKRTVLSRILKRLEFLKLIKNYLTENPTEEFVSKEIARIENRINALMALFDAKAYKEPKKAMEKFERDNGIPKLREQLRALRFILN
jgi:hypothetical protein